jgi:hypothetical protein
MIRLRGLRTCLQRDRMLVAQEALLSLTIISMIVQFSLCEEEESEEDATSPMITPRLECPRCLRQQVAPGRQSAYCIGTWRHPHIRVKMLPQLR